jgi:UDP-N-acetylglucosamine--N-acetylmuramyl-(pentapeptide) pyrophosphoryl-undecaprenol N-acetylglucosamine transferase
MKVVFTGAAGGHFYPLIAIAEALEEIVLERKLVSPQMFYLSDQPNDEQTLFASNLTFVRIPAGRMRRYFSVKNFTDLFITLHGFFVALFTLFRIYPDVVISKGSYASVPVVLAAHLLRIPIIIHESDAKPGRANILASTRATRIAVSYESSIPFFPVKTRSKIARVGIPIRRQLRALPERQASISALSLDPSVPTVLVIGGSQGSQRINETLIDGLHDLVPYVNVIHQTGRAHIDEVVQRSHVVLSTSPFTARYHPLGYLSAEQLRTAASACDVVVSRAGATSIAEISLWQKPAILIPIPESISHDQRTNAYAYAHTGAAVVLEEANMTSHVLQSEIRSIAGSLELAQTMSSHAAGFSNPEAARIIAEEIVRIGLSHEPQTPAPVV